MAQTTVKVKTKAPDDSSHKYNTSTGKLNPKYKAPSTKSASSGLDSVRKIQQQLNARGAKLAVDGIKGPKTLQAMAKYGISTDTGNDSLSKFVASKVTKKPVSSTPIRQTQATSYNKLPGSTISMPKAKKEKGFLGNLFSKIGKTYKDSILASSANYTGYVDNPTDTFTPPTNPLAVRLATSGMTGGSKIVQNVADNIGKADSVFADEDYENSSQNIDLSLGNPTPGIPNLSDTSTTTNTDTPTTTSTGTDTGEGEVTIDPVIQEQIETGPSTTTNANILNNLNQLNTGLKGDLNSGGTAWMSDGSKSEFQNNKIINYATNAAAQFTTPEQAVAFYKTPEGINSLPNGIKPEDIISKVKPVVNGIVGAQTTPEYLTKLGKAPAALAQEKALKETQLTTLANFATDSEKLMYSQLEKDKIEAETQKNYYEEKLLRDENSVRDRYKLNIDKYKAEKKEKSAEIEMNRVQGKSNLTEFLAKIGALRTDGNAQTGLELLEQKYQAQKLASDNSYDFAIRGLQLDMSDKLNELESNTEQKIIDINSDLSKSEREINMDVMKLRFDTKMKGLDYVDKFQDSIKTENEKARAKAEKNTSDYNAMLLELMVDKNVPFDIAKTMINWKGQVNPTQENVNTIKSFGAEAPEKKPAYKGEVFNIGKNEKIVKKIEDATGMQDSDIQEIMNQLQQGWSLEQIAKNSGMPNNIYNALRPHISVPK